MCYNTELKKLCIMHHEGRLIDHVGDKLFYVQDPAYEDTDDEDTGDEEAEGCKIVIRQLYEDEGFCLYCVVTKEITIGEASDSAATSTS